MGKAKHIKKNYSLSKRLSNIYYNPLDTNSLGGLKKLSKAAKKKHPTNEATVQDWLSSQDTYTLHRRALKKFQRRNIVVNGMEEQLQADLIDMSKFKQFNDGHSFILSVIDVFSKKAWAFPLISKSGIEVSEALSRLLRNNKFRALQFDKGKEFLNKHVKDLLQKNNIHFFTTENEDIKAAVVERWNQTIQTKIYKWFTKSGSQRWIDILPKLTESYNSTPHSATKMAPNNVNYDNEEQVWNTLYQSVLAKPRKVIYKPGDTVRIAKNRTIFEKGYTAKWSTEVFTIKKILLTNSPTYKIEDVSGDEILGSFYTEELQKVNVDDHFIIEKIVKKRKTNDHIEYLVKWKGYPAKYNSWVKDNDMSKIF